MQKQAPAGHLSSKAASPLRCAAEVQLSQRGFDCEVPDGGISGRGETRRMEQQRVCLGLLQRRQCLVPTWRGWVGLVLALAGLAIIGVHTVYPFLAVNAPIPGGVLVVEGWTPDWAMEATVAEFRQHHYDKIFVTGIPMERGIPLSEYKTYAELGAAILLKLGLDTNTVQAVPVPAVRADRTYASAVGLRRWLRAHNMAPASVNLVTGGPHARRSRLLFQKALGNGVKVGVMPIAPRDFEPGRWWRSSPGVRVVIGEVLAYGYARILFRAPKE